MAPPDSPVDASADHRRLIDAVARERDRAAFTALFEHFGPRVKAYLARSGVPADLAEDLAQETLANVWRKAASFDPARAQVSTWIYTIARNLRVDALRRTQPAETASPEGDVWADLDEIPSVDPELCPTARLDGRQLAAAIRAALAQLPHEQAQVLRLSFFDEQPHAAIARELALPLGTVKSRIRLAIAHLRRRLDAFAP